MAAIVGLVTAISADVVAQLAVAGAPPLTDGKILIGKQHLLEQSSAPRVVFVPKTSTFTARSVTGRGGQMSAGERQAELAQRSVRTDTIHFDVHVWGQANPPDPDNDWDATQALYQQVIASTYLCTVGCAEFTGGTWTDSTDKGTALMNAGREFVFGIDFSTPVLESPLPPQLAPSDTKAVTTSQMVGPDGLGATTGCSTP